MALARINPVIDKISCKAGASVEYSFDVINSTESRLRVGVQAIGELKDKGWVKVQGALELDLPPKGQDRLNVSVAVPGNAEARGYSFKLRVYDLRDPERAAESTAVAVIVPTAEARPAPTAEGKPAPPMPVGKKLPWPLIIGAIVGGLVLIGVLVTVLLMLGGDKVPDVTKLSADEARRELTAAGYKVERATQTVEDPDSVDKVIETDPPSGAELDKGKVVTMVVGTAAVQPPAPEVAGQCPEQDAKLCREVGASCFLSINDGSHPHQAQPPPRGYRAGDRVSLCWWKQKDQSSCPNTAGGGFWGTAENFWRKYGWASPPDGWNQCMSQCNNIGGEQCKFP